MRSGEGDMRGKVSERIQRGGNDASNLDSDLLKLVYLLRQWYTAKKKLNFSCFGVVSRKLLDCITSSHIEIVSHSPEEYFKRKVALITGNSNGPRSWFDMKRVNSRCKGGICLPVGMNIDVVKGESSRIEGGVLESLSTRTPISDWHQPDSRLHLRWSDHGQGS
ncbi:uncharacterized protein VTP21DRAFT_4287 [Calcarisporiella thermophila]|uniref:uncharacterized protein n=1 Tax=Calcarisporiella thermophila TaxID=911321 RepID=UPI00374388E5